MYRIQVDERKQGEWQKKDLLFGEAVLLQTLTVDEKTGHVETRIWDMLRCDLPILLTNGRELCLAVVKAFPRALFRLLTGFLRREEPGWDGK